MPCRIGDAGRQYPDTAADHRLTIGWPSRIGQISYGLYLYHLIALFGANVILSRLGIDTGWMVFGLYYLIAVIMAELSFRTLEAYFQGLRKTA